MRSLSLRMVTLNRSPAVAIATFGRRWRGLCQVSRSALLLRTDTNSARWVNSGFRYLLKQSDEGLELFDRRVGHDPIGDLSIAPA